jgi:hypothetical protein
MSGAECEPIIPAGREYSAISTVQPESAGLHSGFGGGNGCGLLLSHGSGCKHLCPGDSDHRQAAFRHVEKAENPALIFANHYACRPRLYPQSADPRV